MSILGWRYAEALFTCSTSSEEAEEWGNTLIDFTKETERDDEVKNFFFHPVIGKEIKKEAIAKIFYEGVSEVFTDFLCLLVEKERLAMIADISEQYQKLKSIHQEELVIDIFFAAPLEESQKTAIGEKYKKMYGARNVKLQEHIDASLLGGVCVQIGDTRIDDTLEGRLKNLHRHLRA